jgi:dihydrofolate reductase
MRRIVVSEFVSVDGVMEDPGGSEGFERGGWAFKFDRGAEGDRFKLDEVMQADALLLGRKTYQAFAGAWPSRTDEAGFADKMNSMPKFVVSRTLESGDWNNSKVIKANTVDEISRLKEQPGGDLLVNGSAQLVRTLAEHDLVDEYRLMVFPVVLGDGKRLFESTSDMKALRLVDSRQVGEDGVVILTYEPKRNGGKR